MFVGNEDIEDDDDSSFLPILPDDNDEVDPAVLEKTIPVVALRNTVLFPGVVLPISVGRDKSLRAIKEADKGSKWIAIFSTTGQRRSPSDPS